jgi:hypothetical protein
MASTQRVQTAPNRKIERKRRVGADSLKLLSEPELWKTLDAAASASISFWQAFMQLRKGPKPYAALDPQDLERLVLIVRAVSWVESRHGTGSGIQPARDPLQCGNPADAWWPQLAGNSSAYDRFVAGGDATSFWANELPIAAAKAGIDPLAVVSSLSNSQKGHQNSEFNPTMSFFWGLPHLIWKTNVPRRTGKPQRPFFLFDSLARRELLDGAVAYNGGGDPKYREKVDETLSSLGWPASDLRNVPLAALGVIDDLKAHIESGQVIFDKPSLKDELLGNEVTAELQALVSHLADLRKIRISSILRDEGHHGEGRAFDVGNEDVAANLLPQIATDAEVSAWNIDEIIFDAKKANSSNDRNKWNYDLGKKHAYSPPTLDSHGDHIHFAVKASKDGSAHTLVRRAYRSARMVAPARSLSSVHSGPAIVRGLQVIDFRTYPSGLIMHSPFSIAGFGFQSVSGSRLMIHDEAGDRGLQFSDLRVDLRQPVDSILLEVGGFAGEVTLSVLDSYGALLQRLVVSPKNRLLRLSLAVPNAQTLEFSGGNGEGLFVEMIVCG